MHRKNIADSKANQQKSRNNRSYIGDGTYFGGVSEEQFPVIVVQDPYGAEPFTAIATP